MKQMRKKFFHLILKNEAPPIKFDSKFLSGDRVGAITRVVRSKILKIKRGGIKNDHKSATQSDY